MEIKRLLEQAFPDCGISADYGQDVYGSWEFCCVRGPKWTHYVYGYEGGDVSLTTFEGEHTKSNVVRDFLNIEMLLLFIEEAYP